MGLWRYFHFIKMKKLKPQKCSVFFLPDLKKLSHDSRDDLEEIVHKESIQYTFNVSFFPQTQNSFYLCFHLHLKDQVKLFLKRFKLMLLHIFNTF